MTLPTDVVMPQMGESVVEGTIVRWLKQVGDKVERDEPLFEISTDKVDAEIPSPVAGVLSEIRAREGETVAVNAVVAVIGSAAAAAGPAPAAAPASVAASAPAAAGAGVRAAPGAARAEDGGPQRLSPLVRRIAKEHNVDVSKVLGTGADGRVTRDDILAFVGQGGSPARPAAPDKPAPAARTEKLSVMRQKIAEHMVLSRRTSAHVHSVFEVDFSRVADILQARKADDERAGLKLTFLSFIIKAVADGLQAAPVINASLDGDTVVYHEQVNVGIAVALDWGLIVPVIRNAQAMTLVDIAGAVADLAQRARGKQLKPDEVSGGTFTVTNQGVLGAQFGMPIINQPQVAILGVGVIEKRAVVVDDAVAVRTMAYFTLGFDHRLIDGAVADRFLSHVKRTIEQWDPRQA